MKYYVYISDSKVDMLLAQIPEAVQSTVVSEFKFNLKIFETSRKTETHNLKDRVTRLQSVVDFLREYGNVGNINAGDEYVFATLPLTMAVFPDANIVFWFGDISSHESPDAGQTDVRFRVALGGSLHHVIGAGPEAPAMVPEPRRFSHSLTHLEENSHGKIETHFHRA